MSNEPKDKRILIIEDDRTLGNLFYVAVEHDGFNVYLARDGAEGLRSIKESPPDLLVLDMMLPEKTGYEIIRNLQVPEYKDIQIIVVSGRFVDDTFRNTILLEHNVKEYLVKPIKVPQLMYKIHSLLKTTCPDHAIAQGKSQDNRDVIQKGR